MDKQLPNLQQDRETAVQRADTNGIEFWFARDLHAPLGYACWKNSQTAMSRTTADQSRGDTKLIDLGINQGIATLPGSVFRSLFATKPKPEKPSWICTLWMKRYDCRSSKWQSCFNPRELIS
jgi:DNA-damage-inducible protein D